MSVSFTMKIRGVPFEAGEKEVFEVRGRRHIYRLTYGAKVLVQMYLYYFFHSKSFNF